VYWSEIANPESCLGSAESLKKVALQFHQVLREILATATPIPFRFPTLLESEDGIEQQLAEGQEVYRGALERIGDAVQYEVVGSWAEDEQVDLATPVSGREYLQRRSQATGRIAAIDSKLKSVTAGCVREWRGPQERKGQPWVAPGAPGRRAPGRSARAIAGWRWCPGRAATASSRRCEAPEHPRGFGFA